MRVSRTSPAVAVALALLAAACTGSSEELPAGVLPIEDILASDIVIEPEPSGTLATVHVGTRIPVACAVVYGIGDEFGAIATDDDMAGGAHTDHAPVLTGLEPDTEYRYVLQGSDAAGNLYRSDVRSFRTPAAIEEAAPGTNVALGATIVDVSSEFSGAAFAGRNAIDGNLGTEWSSAGDGDGAWIVLDLGQETDVVGVRLRTRQMSDGSAIVQSYTVTVDGVERFGPFPVAEAATAAVRARGRRLRFDAEATTGGNTGAIEIEVYASESP